MNIRLVAAATFAVTLVHSTFAFASCRIHNDTGYSFTVESGNTSNQGVGAHTSTSIAAGKIIAKSKDGKSFGGMCKDGDNLEVKEQGGVVFMTLK